MKCKVTTFKTITGAKTLVELKKKKQTQWIIYQDNKPRFFIDIFDLKTESNVIMNSLIFAAKKTIHEILHVINKNNDVNLSTPKTPFFAYIVNLEYKDFYLEHLPEEWLSYSL
jgi:hypothetical protein